MEFREYKYKTEFHAHTKPVSGCGKVEPYEVIKRYSKAGYESIVIANHFHKTMPFYGDKEKALEFYLSGYTMASECGKKCGMNVILGCEIRFSNENTNDYLLFGIEPEDLYEAYDFLEGDFKTFSKAFRNEDKLIIQAHPFRDNIKRADVNLIDGIETFNVHPNHNSRIALAVRFAKEHDLLVSAGTDFHDPGWEALAAVLTKTKIKNSKDVVSVLKSRDYLFDVASNIVIPYNDFIED